MGGGVKLRKNSIKLAAKTFRINVEVIQDFAKRVKQVRKTRKQVKPVAYLTKDDENLCFDIAIIFLYREFENLMLNCLVASINNNSTHFSEQKSINFPKHMSKKVCEYLVCGNDYFDFKDYGGLIKEIKKFVSSDRDDQKLYCHWLLRIVEKYKDPLSKLSPLRNFAAHNSSRAKKAALKFTNRQRMSSSGAWLKGRGKGQKTGENRFTKICETLKEMAEDIKSQAPY